MRIQRRKGPKGKGSKQYFQWSMTLPHEALERLGWVEGTEVLVEVVKDALVMRRVVAVPARVVRAVVAEDALPAVSVESGAEEVPVSSSASARFTVGGVPVDPATSQSTGRPL